MPVFHTQIKFGQVNVRGLKVCRVLVEAFLHKKNVDFMVITKSHITVLKQVPNINEYVWVVGIGSERSMSIVVYTKRQWTHNCRRIELEIDQQQVWGGPRILAIEICERMALIGVYAPTLDDLRVYQEFID